jgi:hypothetical protein
VSVSQLVGNPAEIFNLFENWILNF